MQIQSDFSELFETRRGLLQDDQLSTLVRSRRKQTPLSVGKKLDFNDFIESLHLVFVDGPEEFYRSTTKTCGSFLEAEDYQRKSSTTSKHSTSLYFAESCLKESRPILFGWPLV